MTNSSLTLRIRAFLVIALFAAAGAVADITFQVQDTVDLQRSARKIMLDGFLPEWNTQAARPWGSDTNRQWNAMATPEGPAGYLMMREDQPERPWKITFSGSMFREPLTINLPSDTTLKSDRVRVDVTESTSGKVCVVEWLFPFPEQTAGAAELAIVTFRAEAAGGASLPEVVVRCKKGPQRSSVWGGVTGKGIFIGLLALMYLFVHRKLTRQTGRRESPRQST